MHHHRGHHHAMLGVHHGRHAKMGKFGRHGHHRRGHSMLDGGCRKGRMMIKFGRSCMQGFDQFHPHMIGMMRLGKHQVSGCDVPHTENFMMKSKGHHGHHKDMMKWKCKKGKYQLKGKGMSKEFFRMMTGYSSESDVECHDEPCNEGNDKEAPQGTSQAPTMKTGQKATQTDDREDSQEDCPSSGSDRAHPGGRMRFGRHHVPGCHGSHKGKLKMKFGKGHEGHHKDKMIWKCKKGQRQEGESCNPMRAIFMNMMCSGRRREMWEEFARFMTEYESGTEAEGHKEATNEETGQEVSQGTSQTITMDTNSTSNDESNQKDPQSSRTKDDTV